jgi:hypothetical protein
VPFHPEIEISLYFSLFLQNQEIPKFAIAISQVGDAVPAEFLFETHLRYVDEANNGRSPFVMDWDYYHARPIVTSACGVDVRGSSAQQSASGLPCRKSPLSNKSVFGHVVARCLDQRRQAGEPHRR